MATSTGVTVTSKPFCVNTSATTPDDASSESHGVETNSNFSPSTSSTPSVHSATLSGLSSTQRFATTSTSSPDSSASYMISSISSTSQWNCSINLAACGFSSFKPLRANDLISSTSPYESLGSSKYFISGYFVNIQCGFQPVMTIGSSFSIALSSSEIIAAVEDCSSSHPCKLSYSSMAFSLVTVILAPSSPSTCLSSSPELQPAIMIINSIAVIKTSLL